MGRATLDDNIKTILVKMSDGNPGGLSVLMDLLLRVPEIDPVCALGGLNYILQLDDLGLYGSRIWMLYKDVCGQEIAGVITLFRARQLGHLPHEELDRIIEQDEPYDWRPLVALIQSEVPEFKV